MNERSIPFSDLLAMRDLYVVQVAPDNGAMDLDGEADRANWCMFQAMDGRLRRPLKEVWEELQRWSWMAEPEAVWSVTVLRPDAIFGLLIATPAYPSHSSFVAWRGRMWLRNHLGVLSPTEHVWGDWS
jgi:hypothetical protein